MKNIEIKEIEISKIAPNNYNPNIMPDKTYKHLIREYQRVGYLQPILVRQIKENEYEVIDGAHRLKAAIETGLTTVKCVVAQMDDKTAKLTTINMNKIHGFDEPIKMAKLLSNLITELQPEQLAETIDMDLNELKATINLETLSNYNETEKEEKNKVITCPHCNKQINLSDMKVKKG